MHPQEGGLRREGGIWLCLNTTAIADYVRLWGTAAGAQCLRLSEPLLITIWITNRKSQAADRSVSVPMTLSNVERRDTIKG